MNLKKRLSVFDIPGAIQIGGRYSIQDRSRRTWNRQWTYNPPNGDFSPAPFLAQVYKNRPNYFGFDNLPFTSSNIAVEAWKQNPNLFLQTPTQRVAEEQSRIVGSEQYLTKPFTREELLGAIRRYVDTNKAHATP